MKYQLERTNEEIDDLLNECMDQEEKGGSRFPETTYEQGIIAAIRWLIEKDEYHPME